VYGIFKKTFFICYRTTGEGSRALIFTGVKKQTMITSSTTRHFVLKFYIDPELVTKRIASVLGSKQSSNIT
jgi:hypothetical protein